MVSKEFPSIYWASLHQGPLLRLEDVRRVVTLWGGRPAVPGKELLMIIPVDVVYSAPSILRSMGNVNVFNHESSLV